MNREQGFIARGRARRHFSRDRLHERAQLVVRVHVVHPHAALHRHRRSAGVFRHRRDALGDEIFFEHQTRAERAFSRDFGARASAVQVQLVVPVRRGDGARDRQELGVGAPELQRRWMAGDGEIQKPIETRMVGVPQRLINLHLRVQPGVLREQAHEVAEVRRGVLHHGRDGEFLGRKGVSRRPQVLAHEAGPSVVAERQPRRMRIRASSAVGRARRATLGVRPDASFAENREPPVLVPLVRERPPPWDVRVQLQDARARPLHAVHHTSGARRRVVHRLVHGRLRARIRRRAPGVVVAGRRETRGRPKRARTDGRLRRRAEGSPSGVETSRRPRRLRGWVSAVRRTAAAPSAGTRRTRPPCHRVGHRGERRGDGHRAAEHRARPARRLLDASNARRAERSADPRITRDE